MVMKKKRNKHTFKVACNWTVCAEIEVQATSLAEAMKEVEDGDYDGCYAELPLDSYYLDESFEVDVETSEFLNKEPHKAKRSINK